MTGPNASAPSAASDCTMRAAPAVMRPTDSSIMDMVMASPGMNTNSTGIIRSTVLPVIQPRSAADSTARPTTADDASGASQGRRPVTCTPTQISPTIRPSTAVTHTSCQVGWMDAPKPTENTATPSTRSAGE
jgi:hypothetical protein